MNRIQIILGTLLLYMCTSSHISFVTVASAAELPAGQGQSQAQWTLTTLMHALAQIKTRKDSFTEIKTLAVLDEPMHLSGKLFFSAPDRVEKHIEGPEPSAYIVNGNELLIKMFRQRERKVTLFQYPAIQAFVESIRATLAGDLKTLKEYYHIAFQSKGQHWSLKLEPSYEDMQDLVQEITIKGQDTQLLSIETTQRNNDHSVMNILPHE